MRKCWMERNYDLSWIWELFRDKWEWLGIDDNERPWRSLAKKGAWRTCIDEEETVFEWHEFVTEELTEFEDHECETEEQEFEIDEKSIPDL